MPMLGMWEPLQGLLSSPLDDVKVQALWVIGTALQNNPSAQQAYLTLDPLPTPSPLPRARPHSSDQKRYMRSPAC